MRGETGGTGPDAFPKKMATPRRPSDAKLSSQLVLPIPSITHLAPAPLVASMTRATTSTDP